MTPILLLVAIVAPAWIAAPDIFGPEPAGNRDLGLTTLPLFLLLAPPLHLAGQRLRSLRAEGLLRPAMTGALQLILGSLLLAGLIYAAIAKVLGESPTDFRAALLLALVLTIGEVFPTVGGGNLRDSASGASRLRTFSQAHSAFTILAAVLALPFLLRLASGGTLSSGLGLAGRDLAIGIACGVGWGWLTARWLPRDRASSLHAFLQLLAAMGAAAGAVWAGGSPPLALLACGFLQGNDSAEAPSSSTSPHATIQLLSAAGALAAAGSMLEQADIRDFLAPAAVLWCAQAAVRILILSGFGGLLFWVSPGNVPIRCMPALGWSSFPGPLAAGFLLIARDATSPALRADHFVLAIAFGLLLQGTTAGPILAALARGAVAPTLTARWAKALAARVALRAQVEAADRLSESGDLDEEAAAALREAARSAQRSVEALVSKLAEAQPSLSSDRLSAAVRKVLDAGRAAIAQAREEGSIDERAARGIEADIARRWRMAGAVSFEESLSGGWQLDGDDPAPEDSGRVGNPPRAAED